MWIKGLIISIPFLFCVNFFETITAKKHTVINLFKQITPDERFYLENFFKSNAFADFSYVLFGHKPFSFINYSKPTIKTITSRSINDLKIRKGLEIIYKYQASISPDKFFLHVYDDPSGSTMVLINKQKFLKEFNKNRKDFELILGPHITGKQLLVKIMNHEDFAECINHHEALFGILLGYGRNNSWLFHKKKNLMNQLDEFSLTNKQISLKKELSDINKDFSLLDQSPPQFFRIQPYISLPKFMANSSDLETKKLRKKYSKDRKKISEMQCKNNFCEIVFEKLCL